VAASTAGAVKAYAETLGLGIPFFRDQAPEGEAYPYGTIREQISLVPEAAFSQYDDDDGHVLELVQVDLWQRKKNPATGERLEDFTLADRLVAGLRGAQLPDAPYPVAGVEVVGAPRVPDPDPNLVHHAITITVHRTLARSAP
jgi:hypothetical protein